MKSSFEKSFFLEFVILLGTAYNEDKEGDRMKKRSMIFLLLLSFCICGCGNRQKESDRTIKQINDTRYSMKIIELPGLESMDNHTQITQMDDEMMYFTTYTTFGNSGQGVYYASGNRPLTSFVTKAVYAYDRKQKTLETILEGDGEKVYYDYQMFQGMSYAVIGTMQESSDLDNQLQLTENGIPVLNWNHNHDDLGFYLRADHNKLYLLQYPTGDHMVPALYEVHDKGPLTMVRNAFMTRLNEILNISEMTPQLRVYGNKVTYLDQKEKSMELGIYEHQKFQQYEIPFTGQILAIFDNDVLMQSEDGVCYWNLKQRQRKEVKNDDFKEELTHEFRQINKHQLLYTSSHSLKLYTYRDNDTYLLQDITDQPYRIEMVYGNQILLSQASVNSMQYYLGILKD